MLIGTPAHIPRNSDLPSPLNFGRRETRQKRVKNPRLWLSPTGVELQTEELKRISRTWSVQNWEDYLDWFEGGRREAVISTALYQTKIDELEESIFDTHGPSSCTDSREICEQLLSTLPETEALVLRRYSSLTGTHVCGHRLRIKSLAQWHLLYPTESHCPTQT